MQQKEKEILQNMANAARFLSSDMITNSKAGHPGLPLGTAELITTLFANHLKFSPANPKWENRDRFILSAGHGSSLLYSILYLTGYKDITLTDIQNFRQLGFPTAGHPEYGNLQGIETTTGPLGQGLATAIGIAIGEKIKQAKLGTDIVNNHIYTLVGDGCLAEGISEEAISLAGTLNLNNLIVIWDNNNITIDGTAEMSNKTNMIERFKANNWNTIIVDDGYDFDKIDTALTIAKSGTTPTFISVKTIIGKGLPAVENTSDIHGTPLTPEQRETMATNLNWTSKPFEIPSEILKNWQAIGIKYDNEVKSYNKNLKTLTPEQAQFLNLITTHNEPNIDTEFINIKKHFFTENYDKATRNASGEILSKITSLIPNMIGLTADLAKPTCTLTKDSKPITATDFNGNFISAGVREHLMAALLNGLYLSGFKPYGGTFLAFQDYLKPALRLSALMRIAPIYVFTHDSILLGEDGPTHQPIEQLATLRAMPNIIELRPADAIETTEAWEISIKQTHTPTAIILSRQNTPLLRKDVSENLTALGGYIIKQPLGNSPQLLTLIATGTEVAIAIQVQKILFENHSINASVVSLPSWKLFEMQSEDYRNKIINPNTICISVEAGSTFGWDKYADIKIGIDTFGESGKKTDLANHFGFTAEKITERILTDLKQN